MKDLYPFEDQDQDYDLVISLDLDEMREYLKDALKALAYWRCKAFSRKK